MLEAESLAALRLSNSLGLIQTPFPNAVLAHENKAGIPSS